MQLVEVGGQPLGQPPRVGEDDGRAVGQDQVEDLGLDVRPDRRRCAVGASGSSASRAGSAPDPRLAAWPGGAPRRDRVMSSTGTTMLQIPRLLRGRCHHPDRQPAAEERRHPLGRPDRGRQPDPLRRGDRVGAPRTLCRPTSGLEPLQRHGQVGAALGAGQGVHLVDDHRLDVAQGVAGRRGQHQEQRLGGGDQDVRRVTADPAPLGRPGCRPSGCRPQTSGRRLAEPRRRLADPGQRRAQVALDVDRERLQR